MSDANKNPEVEIDLDHVKETDVKIEETKQEESKQPDLNAGEVDLGYTEHDKEQPKEDVAVEEVQEEPTQETKQQSEPDDLTEVSESVKKRIDKLTRKFREAERREQAALDFAKGLQKKYDDTQTKYDSTDEKYLKEFDARVDAQREQVKVALKQAIESNDASQIMEANDKLTQLAVEKEKARLELSNREKQKKEEEAKKTTNNVQAEPQTAETSQTAPQITPRAKKWAEENTWFGNDEVMTNAAITIHNNISQEGIEVDSDEYYNEVNSRLKRYFPESFDNTNDEPKKETPKPVQTVASAGRSQQGRRTVKLTKSQVAIAKRLNVPLEEYARYVKEDN